MTGQVVIGLLFYAWVDRSVLLRFAQKLWRVGSAGLLPRPLPVNFLVSCRRLSVTAPPLPPMHSGLTRRASRLPHIVFCRVMLLPVCEVLGMVGCKKQNTVQRLYKQSCCRPLCPFSHSCIAHLFNPRRLWDPASLPGIAAQRLLMLPCLALSSIRHTSTVSQATCSVRLHEGTLATRALCNVIPAYSCRLPVLMTGICRGLRS